MAVSASPDHYAALGVDTDASVQEIEAAWRFQLLAFHPDRFRDQEHRQRAEEISKRLNAAWQVLGDADARRRYDLRRRQRASANGGEGSAGRPVAQPPPPPTRRQREIPCPTCASMSRVDDPGGAALELRCPACSEQFVAVVGATMDGRPGLERRWMRIDYEMRLTSDTGQRRAVRFRRLPKELALADGMRISVVFHPRRGHPVYAIGHQGGVDMMFPVR